MSTTTHNPETLPNTAGKDSLKELNESIQNSVAELEATKNQFPIDVFPKLFQDITLDLKQSLNFPDDYTGIAFLTAVATALGTSVRVQVKQGWYEYPSLYSGIVGGAGANKSHPVAKVFESIKSIDKANHEIFKKELADYLKMNKEELEQAGNPAQPTLLKLALANFTPEVLSKRLSENLRGCVILTDELTTFLDGMNNYSKGDQIGIYLSFWSNQSTTIDRIGNPIPLFIEKPCLSIIGGIQPRALQKAFPLQKIDNGFFQRFLFAYPDNVGKEAISDNEMNKELFEKYERFISDYIKDNPVDSEAETTGRTLKFNTEANTFFREWQSDNCNLVNENDGIKAEIITKYDNHFIRLSLIIQMMENPKSVSIQINAVKGAKRLCAYFMTNAFKVLAKIQSPDDYLKSLPKNKQDLYKSLAIEFSTAGAVAGGTGLGIPVRTIKRFLKDAMLFEKIAHGTFRKLSS